MESRSPGRRWRPTPAVPRTMLEIGSVNLFVIQRGDLLLLRVRDREHPDRHHFAGIDSFEIDSRWRFSARFEEYDPVKPSPDRQHHRTGERQPELGRRGLRARGRDPPNRRRGRAGDEQLFLIIGDATSGKETYGGGRYLYVDAPDADGRIDLDFNRAYNPPCAFTPFATCPLPPPQNRLALRIEAGEKNYAGGDH